MPLRAGLIQAFLHLGMNRVTAAAQEEEAASFPNLFDRATCFNTALVSAKRFATLLHALGGPIDLL